MVVTMEHLHEMLDADTWWQARMQQVHERNRQLEPLLNQVCQTLTNDASPIRAEAVQQMMLAEGVRPESNSGSSGILEMREE